MTMLKVGDREYPFDEDIFAEHWYSQPDLAMNALVQSGALVADDYIASLIANGSNQYTIPFYGLLPDDAADNYDGRTDITTSTLGASKQTGVVYGRAHAWEAVQFIADFTTANPMAAIAARTAKYWQNSRQSRLVSILEAVLGLASMKGHSVQKSSVGPTTLTDACQEVFGAGKSMVAMAVMHSAVAQEFEDIQIADYLKHTDANGVTREVAVFTVNGIPTVIDDGVPTTPASGAGDAAKPPTYTTYLLGNGCLRFAQAPVTLPVETSREPLKSGGVDFLINRLRETVHPNGFNFSLGTGAGWTESPTDAQLGAKANWSLAHDAAAVPVAKLVTPGHAA